MAEKVDIFLPLFVADYLADTTDLTTEEHGAYLLLLMASWRNGGTITSDHAKLARIAKLSKAYTYCVSRAGITGTHAGGAFDSGLIERVAASGAPPPVFGFGISRPEHVHAALSAGARGVICGSAIVEKVGLGEDVTCLIRLLKGATRERVVPAMN